MNTDYAYCLNEGSCIHRRGCRRWLGHYTEQEKKELVDTGRDQYINDEDCRPDHSNTHFPDKNYDLLDRFRLSNGEDFK